MTESEWAARRPAPPLQQSWAYGQAMAALGARPFWQGRVQGLARRGLRLVQRAELDAASARRLARHAGATVVTAPLSGRGIVPLVTACHHAEWDLTPDPARLRAGLAGKWRNALSGSEGLALRQGGEAARNALLARCAEQARQRGYRGLPEAFLHAWPGRSLLLHHSPGGEMAAAMLFLIHAGAATYHLGWTSPAGRAAGAHRAMLWQAALHLRDTGVVRLDLGAVDTGNPGLARFKLGTGAQIVPLGPTSLVLPM